MSSQANFETNLCKAEYGFNIAGSIPGVAVLSGALRVTMGKVQFIAGTFFALFSLLVAGCSRGIESDKWLKRAQLGGSHILHGIANTFKGATECLLGVTLIGSAIPLTVQLIIGFKPYLTYHKARGF